MSGTKPERKKRVRTIREKASDDGDFLIGMVIGIVVAFFCGPLMFAEGFSRSKLAYPYLACLAIIVAALLLVYHLRKRGQRLVLHGMIVSLLLGLFLVGLCTIR